jgi:hypothetical protein
MNVIRLIIVFLVDMCMRRAFMLRLRPAGYAQHEREEGPLALSVAERSRRAHKRVVQRLGSLFPSHFKKDSYRNPPFAWSRPVWRISLAGLSCLITAPSLAHAHGGMAGSELGPPLVTSGLLGFVCYWLVMLWPSAKKDVTAVGSNTPNRRPTPRTRRHARQNYARVKQVPRLRKIERSGRVVSNMNSGRKATDG